MIHNLYDETMCVMTVNPYYRPGISGLVVSAQCHTNMLVVGITGAGPHSTVRCRAYGTTELPKRNLKTAN